MGRALSGRVLLPGAARGRALVLQEPLSFWGGVDPASGQIIDRRHPQRGKHVAGRVLALPSGRGSSSASSVLAEALRRGTGPAAILLAEPDGILLLGAMVAGELYGTACPVLVLPPPGYARLRTGQLVTIEADGRLRLEA